MIRFVHLFNYAEGVTREDGEAWYLKEHVARARELPGLVGYMSWPQVDVGIPYPSAGAPHPYDQFVRRSELQFEDLTTALAAVHGSPSLWAPSLPEVPGFREFECMFLREEPEYNLLTDAPPQHYKYMTLPLWWPQGQPIVDEQSEFFINSYCVAYRDDLPTATAEDWYLGHHTREGKQIPGIRHYRTWKTIRVPEGADTAIQPNKWYRLTELGISPEGFMATMVHEETRIRFTPSPFGSVIGNWLNVSIYLGIVDDFLA